MPPIPTNMGGLDVSCPNRQSHNLGGYKLKKRNIKFVSVGSPLGQGMLSNNELQKRPNCEFKPKNFHNYALPAYVPLNL